MHIFRIFCIGCVLDMQFVTPTSLKFYFIASKVKLMDYLIYFEGDIILYYDIHKENK